MTFLQIVQMMKKTILFKTEERPSVAITFASIMAGLKMVMASQRLKAQSRHKTWHKKKLLNWSAITFQAFGHSNGIMKLITAISII